MSIRPSPRQPEKDAPGYSASVSTLRGLWRRLRGVDPRLLDGVLAAALGIGAAAQLFHEDAYAPARLLPVLGTTAPLAWRRRYPLACFTVQFACALLTLRLPMVCTLVALFIALYSIGVYSPHRWVSLIAPVGSAAILAVLFPTARPPLPAAAVELLLGLAMWLLGNTVRGLEERALRLERERELATRAAVAGERARIARELHDVVAHSVSVMVVQAGGARRLLSRQPERAGEALIAVERGGREALTELRHLLGLLAGTDGDAAGPPQAGLGQLQALVERVAGAGLPARLEIAGSPRPLPAGLELTAYRVIQEALTNAFKHAPGARTEVTVTYSARELRLEVVDAGGVADPDATGAGRGLLGMRERVAVYGGELEAGPRAEGGFAVRARLPLDPDGS